MRKIIVFFIFVLSTMGGYAQNQTLSNSVVSPDNAISYRLFPTANMWTFIKLNTRTGQMWQVQYSTGKDRLEVPLDTIPRISKEKEKDGRFFLYPTQNMYNFILLDQFDGRIWQVQWAIAPPDRIVVPINMEAMFDSSAIDEP